MHHRNRLAAWLYKFIIDSQAGFNGWSPGKGKGGKGSKKPTAPFSFFVRTYTAMPTTLKVYMRVFGTGTGDRSSKSLSI